MSVRRKNIDATRDALTRTLDQREVLLGKLVRLELKLQTLKKRIGRQQKARDRKVGSGDLSIEVAGTPRPYRFDSVDATSDMDDEIPL